MASPDSTFLTRASESVFDLGLDGFRLGALTLQGRRLAVIDTGAAGDPPCYADGPPPVPGREGRREHDWQPAADAPAWMQMAWLLEDLATWVHPLAEEHITLTGIEAPESQWCDVLLRDGDTAYRVRILLTGRDEPLDFPGMYLRDMFTEGRHRDHLMAEEPGDLPVVDLRSVL
ncbi:hypothetical protein [Streptomyces sp. NPDC051776]|uniref:hypothetical protein n=1 Tax=Streptomyces sp. NPDC051776 TaxID=3155414 RepID=UPI00344023FB